MTEVNDMKDLIAMHSLSPIHLDLIHLMKKGRESKVGHQYVTSEMFIFYKTA